MNFELDLDSESVILKEGIDNSFRAVFDIQNFSVELVKERPNIDIFFQEQFAPEKHISFGVSLDESSNVYDSDFRKFFEIHTFNIFCESNQPKDFNEDFQNFFDITSSSLNLSTLQNLKPQKKVIEEPEMVLEQTEEVVEEEVIVEVEKPFPFRVSLNESNFVYDCDFRKYFHIHNFETCVDRSKNVDDLIFEDYFEIKKQPEYDYNIIENLRKDLNSRKIVTREERENVVLNEPEVSVLEDVKQSIELNVEETTSTIKENHFYKIVEVDAPEYIEPEPEIEVSYKDEVEQQLSDMENKYEDLLQKTKENYESQLSKMINDFSDFRNHINQQVTKMSFISSATGGGAVNILDMDDVDKTNLSNGYTLSYNGALKKFQFINPSTVGSSASFDNMQSDVFTITQPDLDNEYLDLSFAVDSNYYDISEVQINGVVNYYPLYSFTSSNRLDISNLDLHVGDKVRVVYIKS